MQREKTILEDQKNKESMKIRRGYSKEYHVMVSDQDERARGDKRYRELHNLWLLGESRTINRLISKRDISC